MALAWPDGPSGPSIGERPRPLSGLLSASCPEGALCEVEERGAEAAPWRCAVRIGDRDPELVYPGTLLFGLLAGTSTTSTPDSSAALVSS